MSMKADTLKPQALFWKPVRYEIPQFQRPYVWAQETQWEPLWNDVKDAAESYIENDQKKTHFMGAVVLQQHPHATTEVETRFVVDGQQRLTTIQLFLDAAQKTFKHRGCDDPAQRLSDLVKNAKVYQGGEPDHAFKIWPTASDREAFRHAMRSGLASTKYEESLIVQAHNFFKNQICSWLDDFPEEIEHRVDALEKAMCQFLELVVIDIEPSDDPHIIFETLNARGTPLLQSDLVKNLILHEARNSDGTGSENVSQLWNFDDDWWRTDKRQGRLVRPHIDVFLNYWTATRNRKEVAASDIFPEFRKYVEGKRDTESIQEITSDIDSLGSVYRDLEQKNSDEHRVAMFLNRREIMEAGAVTPVLLRLFSSGVPEPQIIKSLRALESYLVRRMFCRMTTKDYNHLFIRLLDRFSDQGITHAGDTIVEYLARQDAYARKWPDDQMLEKAFVTKPIFRLLTRGRLRLVLEGIEEALRTDKSESLIVQGNLTIEHIMPQQWQQNWPPLANDPPDMRTEMDREDCIHSIGNLTLVTQKLNSTLSNAPWDEKQKTLSKHSVLFLNKDLLDNAPTAWNEGTIAQRARKLHQTAINVWPHASDI